LFSASVVIDSLNNQQNLRKELTSFHMTASRLTLSCAKARNHHPYSKKNKVNTTFLK